MKTSSAKAKGRRLQNWVRDILRSYLDLEDDDVTAQIMGASGEDILLSTKARRAFPYSVECKNTEKLNVWKAYEQAQSNCKGFEPVVFITRNRSPKLVVLDAEYFIDMHREEPVLSRRTTKETK
jgi:hypothetical protein